MLQKISEWLNISGMCLKTFHHSRRKTSRQSISLLCPRDILDLNEVDVIISTRTFFWPSNVNECCECHLVWCRTSHTYSSAGALQNWFSAQMGRVSNTNDQFIYRLAETADFRTRTIAWCCFLFNYWGPNKLPTQSQSVGTFVQSTRGFVKDIYGSP